MTARSIALRCLPHRSFTRASITRPYPRSPSSSRAPSGTASVSLGSTRASEGGQHMAIKYGNGKHGKDDPARVRKCAVYLRVSKALKSKGKAIGEYTSIDAQRDTCLEYIKRKPGYTYVDQYIDDGRSGKNLNRKSVQRLFADIDAGKIDTVIVYKMDRL